MILAKNRKKGAKKWRNRIGQKSVLSLFFPIPIFYLSFLGTSLRYIRVQLLQSGENS